MGVTESLRCPIAIVQGDQIWRCQLNYGHRQWHQSFEHGNPGTIWPHDLGVWTDLPPAMEETLPERLPRHEIPEVRKKVARPEPKRKPVEFSWEDWAENASLTTSEPWHADPRNYGLPAESTLWWDDEYDLCKGWEPEDGLLGEREWILVKVARKQWG